MKWSDFEHAAPALAAAARQRLGAARIALLGTVRSGGAPRISPVEPYFAGEHLLFGAMAWSRKATDLLRDPRLVLHSTVTGPDNEEPEVKLYGQGLEAEADAYTACGEGWWMTSEAPARVFSVDVSEAGLIEWDLPGAELAVTTWSPTSGVQTRTRRYP